MLSHQQLRGNAGACRRGAGQAGGVARSLVVGRLVVANATRLRAAEDEEAVFSVSSGLQLKSRRSRAAAPPQLAVNDATIDPQTFGSSSSNGDAGINGADAAALRDATATASTSGNGLPLPHVLNKRKLSAYRTASAHSPALDPEEPEASLTNSSGFDPPPPGGRSHGQHGADAASGATTPEASAASGDQSQQQQQQPQLQPAPRHPVHPLPAGVTPERDLEIHNELRGCEDWRDVLDVVADEVACLSVRTAVQALTRLNMLTRGSVAARRELLEHTAFQTLKEVLFAQVSLMNNVQLSNSLQALAQLQVELPALLLEGFAAAVVARADTFYPRDISTLLAAAAALRWSPPQELLDALGFRATVFLSSSEFDARSIPTLLHSIALLGYNNQILAEAAAQRLAAPGVVPSLIPQGVANAMWALGRMHTYHPPAVAAALAAFSSAPLSYKPQEVANLLWSLTSFRHHPEGAFVLFARSLLNRPQGQIRPADVATLLYALAFFNVSPGEQAMERLQAAALAMLGPEAPAPPTPAADAAAADAAAAPAAAAAPPAPARPPRGAVSMVELAHMYWGLALLGAVEGPLFGRLERELAAVWEREGAAIPESLLRIAFQGFLASRLESPRRSHSFPPLALDAFKRAWTSSVVDESIKRGRGRRVDQVAGILDSLRVTYDKRRPTGDGLAVIDIALKAGAERYIALQVIDTSDRCANSKQLLGPVVMVGQVLEKNGWEVRYLRTGDLDSLTPDMQTRFVEELVRGMGVRPRKAAGGGAAAGQGKAAAAAGEGKAAAAAGGRSAGKGGERVKADADAAGDRGARSSSSSSPSSSRTLKARSRR